ncbi:MAG: hypothetical protein ACK40M_13255 [Flavobacteriales bacterium]
MKKIILLATLFLIGAGASVNAQYNACAAKNVITEKATETYVDQTSGQTVTRTVERKVNTDKHGNANGNQYDLAVDGAFDGQTIVVLHLYTGEGFDFSLPKAALQEKGFSVYRYMNQPPSPKELKEALDKACQLWVISTTSQLLNEEHAKVIKEFWDKGHGVYLWGDNDPYHADANYLSRYLIGADMEGFYYAANVVTLKSDSTVSGLQRDHLITTGLEYIYEGITIAKIHDHKNVLTPLIWSSDGNVVTSVYEKDGKRLILDGGFTRLYINWDTAGTGRYVKNAAAWLVNYEKFGDAVVSTSVKNK